ncbi:MAG: DNA repair protein RadA [Micavibrio sp.]|nr:MAG: DNA repair protein RadA [Micavibrio sp.]
MAKTASQYICQSCGSVYNKWAGKCDGCGEWNSITQEAGFADAVPKGLGRKKGRVIDFVPLSGVSAAVPRRACGIKEFDRVTGGGLVAGSAILIGGDPGIGKSTLLLQAVCHLASAARCCYVSGEEAVDQVRMRAARLGLADKNVRLAAATNIRDIVSSMEAGDVDLIVIDSIQTMYIDSIDSAPGTVSQVRAASQELIRCAKKNNIILFLVGHVTKEGQIAGPRVVEHMVDTVLHFEGDRGHPFRILRAVKNRFGPTDEIGVFEMAETGLVEVENPSALFLSQRQDDISGSAVFAGMEGTRPVLVEIQALVAPSPLGTPRRAVIGWDSARLAMILAVLEARCGVEIGMNDVYLNVAGGLRITEPAADLAVAAALLSSMKDIPLPADTVVFGEIGLSGEIRHVSQAEHRLKEAAKLGFSQGFIPRPLKSKKTGQSKAAQDIKVVELDRLAALLPFFAIDQ